MLDQHYTEIFQAWLANQMPVLLVSAGWSKLKLGDCDSAISHLRRADALIKSIETTKGLAICYYKLKNFLSASEQFQSYFDLNIKDPQLLTLYADTLESLGNYSRAVQLYEEIMNTSDEITNSQRDSIKNRLKTMRERQKESVLQLTEYSRNFQS